MRNFKLETNMNFKIALFCLASRLSNQALAQDFIEGTHYSIIELAKQSSNSKEAVEYFSFSCPGCFAMENYIRPLHKALPSKEVRRVHMPFGGRNAKLSQKAFVLMELLDATQHHQDVFNRIHLQKKTFNDEQEIVTFFKH
jgi:thiol:disulfide interchange protein DsbA